MLHVHVFRPLAWNVADMLYMRVVHLVSLSALAIACDHVACASVYVHEFHFSTVCVLMPARLDLSWVCGRFILWQAPRGVQYTGHFAVHDMHEWIMKQLAQPPAADHMRAEMDLN